eukprot:2826904-Rhodomonas_salina.1
MLIFIIQGGWGVGARCNAETRAMISGVRGATARHDDRTDGNTLIVLRGVTVIATRTSHLGHSRKNG